MGDFQTTMSIEELRRRNEESRAQAEAERRAAEQREKN